MNYQSDDPVRTLEGERRATARVLAAVGLCSYVSDDPREFMRLRGFGGYLTKAAVAPILSTDDFVAAAGLDAGLLAAVERTSMLGRLESAGAIRIGLNEPFRIIAASMTAGSVSEGAPKPVGRADFGGLPAAVKAVGEIVQSREAVTSFNPQSQQGLTRSLVSAVAGAVDEAIVAALTAGTPAGSADPGVLLAAISDGAPVAPVLMGDYIGLLGLDRGLVRDLRDLGVAIMVSAAASGNLIAVDAPGLVIAADAISVEVGPHATRTLSDDGSGSLVSMWQKNLVPLRAEQLLQIGFRPDAVAFASVS